MLSCGGILLKKCYLSSMLSDKYRVCGRDTLVQSIKWKTRVRMVIDESLFPADHEKIGPDMVVLIQINALFLAYLR